MTFSSAPNRRTQPGKSLVMTLHVTMSLAYLGCGAFLLLSPKAGRIVPAEYSKIVAGSLLIYGAFRMYRAYSQWQLRNRF